MSTRVEKQILVNVPVSEAYKQWTRFEDFPHFMPGVESVTRLGDDRLKWVARIAGVRREWEANILEQVPDRRVAWAATAGATNSGAAEFDDAGSGRTSIKLTLEYQPEGLVEKVGNLLHIVGRQAEHDLKKFKQFIEHEGRATGDWQAPVPGGAQAGASPEYNRFAHPFDQTNGLVDFEGESDETAEGENYSAAERLREQRRHDGNLPPMGGGLGQH
ncbi:cyclase/dehydrase [Arthrobacter sp. FB24]|uniref:SRPBCC family protein n=1 Tax=Arthrobacter sp. (strain FB24) TaxID=290399 RepID=UPI00005275D4|nr:SRPBCC family protein [Arthrobacter sp. FB24]ABK05053.1 cyclase/dehydrase [Arthrobacter sp. FB24]